MIEPIETDRGYREALAAVERSWEAKIGTPEGDRLDALIERVSAWEAVHHPIPSPDAVSMIEFRMDQAGLTRADLEPYIGSGALVADVLDRRRALSADMIRRLREGLGIPFESSTATRTAADGRTDPSERWP